MLSEKRKCPLATIKNKNRPISSDYIHTSFFKTGKTSGNKCFEFEVARKSFLCKLVLEGFPVLPAQCGEDKQVIVTYDSAKAFFFLFYGHKCIKQATWSNCKTATTVS